MQPPSHGEHTGWRASDYPSGHGRTIERAFSLHSSTGYSSASSDHYADAAKLLLQRLPDGPRSLGNIGGEGGLSDSTCDVAGQQERPYISG